MPSATYINLKAVPKLAEAWSKCTAGEQRSVEIASSSVMNSSLDDEFEMDRREEKTKSATRK